MAKKKTSPKPEETTAVADPKQSTPPVLCVCGAVMVNIPSGSTCIDACGKQKIQKSISTAANNAGILEWKSKDLPSAELLFNKKHPVPDTTAYVGIYRLVNETGTLVIRAGIWRRVPVSSNDVARTKDKDNVRALLDGHSREFARAADVEAMLSVCGFGLAMADKKGGGDDE